MTDTFVSRAEPSLRKLYYRPCYWPLARRRMVILGRVKTPHETRLEILRSTLCFHKLNRLELRVLLTFNAALAIDRQSTITTSQTRYRNKPHFPGTCVTKAVFLAAVFARFELLIGQKVPIVWMACRLLFGACGVENPLSKDGQRKVSPALPFNFLAPQRTRNFLVKMVEAREKTLQSRRQRLRRIIP
jgi:hypothetical protein